MRRYLFNRMLHQLGSLAALIVVVFLVTHLIGDPVRLMLPDWATDDMIQATRQKYGLDAPLYVQFFRYVAGLFRLDFGMSIKSNVPNLDLILSRLPATFILAIVGTALAASVGVLLGTLAALKPSSIIDRIITLLTSMAVTSLD